jgi:hypothetical protein
MIFGAQTVEREPAQLQKHLDAELARAMQRLHELSLDEEPELVPFRMTGLWSDIADASTDPIKVNPNLWRRAV